MVVVWVFAWLVRLLAVVGLGFDDVVCFGLGVFGLLCV